jgi:hypothetical protein
VRRSYAKDNCHKFARLESWSSGWVRTRLRSVVIETIGTVILSYYFPSIKIGFPQSKMHSSNSAATSSTRWEPLTRLSRVSLT